ncbi:ubiquitin-related modifier 1 [Sitophilus oryzae]|uniref:Ubiquitin-related modifier 1 homolog n=1 Tax=Sitophilus oryzae TaxID=7048 RepID=A0A6J2YG55_SITOR|nr:ubiquitin-related modifier 1 [Sitophilus oryzae]
MKVNCEYGGGCDLLFGTKQETYELPSSSTAWTVGELLLWLAEKHLKTTQENFLQGDSVRPGILVMINEMDWELLDTTNYVLKENDTVIFFSTLHGG